MSKRPLDRGMTRRGMISLAGSAAIALPPMMSLFPRVALGQSSQRIRRVILIPGQVGMNPTDFFPATPGLNLQTMQTSTDRAVFTTPLANLPNGLSRALGPAFDSPMMREKMNLYEGLDLTHGSEIVSHTHGALGGVAKSNGNDSGYEPMYGETIDNILARALAFSPQSVPLKVLRVQTMGGQAKYSFTRNNGQIRYEPFILGDSAVFSAVFGQLQNQPNQASTAESARAQDREFVLQKTFEAYTQLKSNKRLSAQDRDLLNQFTDNINSIRNNINSNSNSVTCSVPNIPLQVRSVGNSWAFPGAFENGNWGVQSCTAMINNISDIIVNAFICDQTRVVVWANNIWQDNPISGYSMGAMLHSHDDGNGGPLTTADKHAYFLNRLAYLAERLDSIVDPHSDSGTLLDNSLILVTNEHSSVVGHHSFSIPSLTIGGYGGRFQTGLYFDCRQRPYTTSDYHPGIGRPAKQLLQSILQAGGLDRSAYINIGDGNGFGDFSTHPMGANDPRNYTDFRSTHNDALPYLLR